MIQRLVLLAAAAAASFGLIDRGSPAPWVINETPSVPPGLYRRIARAPEVGRYVTVTPPPAAAAYLRTLGAPADARLLKRVAAGPSERVCTRPGVLAWPGGEVRTRARDRRGRPLLAWRGCRPLQADELLVLGESAASFDSRYFGPVRRSAVAGVYEEVWTW